MYHVQIRAGVHAVKVFNLTEAEVQARFLTPLAAGVPFRMEDRDWEPRETRLSVFEGPRLRPDQIAMGRGWPNVERSGTEVTEQLRAGRPAPPVSGRAGSVTDQLKDRLIGRLSADAIRLDEVVAVSAQLSPGQRVSEQLATAELAVWELLHHQQARLQRHGVTVPEQLWQQTLLTFGTWLGDGEDVSLSPFSESA